MSTADRLAELLPQLPHAELVVVVEKLQQLTTGCSGQAANQASVQCHAGVPVAV